MQSERVQLAIPPWTRWVKILTITHVVLYIVWLTMGRWGAWTEGAREAVLVPGAVQDGHLWQLVTYLFPQASPLGLLFDALMLWMFGGELESRWGARRFLTFYFGVAVGAAGLLVALSYGVSSLGRLPVLGPGGVMLALIVAWGMIYANRRLNFWGFLPLTGRHLLLLSLGITALVAFASDPMTFVIHAFAAMLAAALVTFWRRHGGIFSTLRMALLRYKAKRARRHLRPVDDDDRRYLH